MDPYVIAKVYDGLGDSDRAMEWLERSYTEHSPFVPGGIRSEFWTDRLRSDPRFQDLLRRMKYPAERRPMTGARLGPCESVAPTGAGGVENATALLRR